MNLWLGMVFTGGPSWFGLVWWLRSLPFDFDLFRIFAGGEVACVGAPFRLVSN